MKKIFKKFYLKYIKPEESLDLEVNICMDSSDSDMKNHAGLHPLLFPPVLNKVFGYISFWNQKKCRLVCKTWEQELRPFLRRNCKVNLSKLTRPSNTDSNREEIESDFYESTSCCSLIERKELIDNLNKICTSYVIEDYNPILKGIITDGILHPIKYLELWDSTWDLYQVQKLILRELPSLEELRLPIQCAVPSSKDATKDKNDNEEFNLMNLATFPKLKVIIVTLTIRDLQFYTHKNTSITPLLKLLQNAPNLEEIYYPNIVQFTSPFDNPARVLFENIIMSSPNTTLTRLTTLKIDTYLCNQDLEILQDKGLPLKSLQISLTPDISCGKFYEFLLSMNKTLNSLALTFRDGFRLTSTFPKMTHLNQMAVILWNGYLDFIQDIPQVKTLVTVMMEMEVEMIEKNSTADFCNKSKIKDLEIHAARAARANIVQKLIRLSPTSLKRLTIDSITDCQLQTIYLTLPWLEELVILYGGFTPAGITGIPETFCKDEYCDKEFYALGLKERLGMEDLKNLRSLTLTGDITDFIIILGVVRCRKLKHLELMARLCSKVSEKSTNKIADTLNLNFLRLRNFTEIPNSALDYLQTKFSGIEMYLNCY